MSITINITNSNSISLKHTISLYLSLSHTHTHIHKHARKIVWACVLLKGKCVWVPPHLNRQRISLRLWSERYSSHLFNRFFSSTKSERKEEASVFPPFVGFSSNIICFCFYFRNLAHLANWLRSFGHFFWQTNLCESFGQQFFTRPRYVVNSSCLVSDKLQVNIKIVEIHINSVPTYQGFWLNFGKRSKIIILESLMATF